MRLEAAMLANHAEANGSLLSVLGGGWEHFAVGALPAIVTGYVAGIAAREPEEMGTDIAMDLSLYDPGGTAAAAATIRFTTLHVGTAQGVPARTAFAFPFSIPVNEPGVFRVSLVYDDAEIASLPFDVQGPL
jgi:hypothetical protein